MHVKYIENLSSPNFVLYAHPFRNSQCSGFHVRMDLIWQEDTYLALGIGLITFVGAPLFGIIPNIFALNFFWKSIRHNIFAPIFCAVTLTDLLTSCLVLFVGLCYLQDRRPGLFADPIFREVWGSLWNFSSRYSVYLVAVLSITRTVRIIFPFTVIKTWVVRACLVLYAAWLVGTTPGFYGIKHYYKKEWCALGLNKSQFVKSSSHDFKYYTIVLSIPIFLLIPVPLTFVSASASFVKIIMHSYEHRKRMISRHHGARVSLSTALSKPGAEGPREKVKGRSLTRDGTFQSGMTIVLITVIYLILNIPYSVIYIYVQTKSRQLSIPVTTVMKNPYLKTYMVGTTHVLSIALNAALNPLLYYLRMNDFREQANSVVVRLRVRMRRWWKKEESGNSPRRRSQQAHFTIFSRSKTDEIAAIHEVQEVKEEAGPGSGVKGITLGEKEDQKTDFSL